MIRLSRILGHNCRRIGLWRAESSCHRGTALSATFLASVGAIITLSLQVFNIDSKGIYVFSCPSLTVLKINIYSNVIIDSRLLL